MKERRKDAVAHALFDFLCAAHDFQVTVGVTLEPEEARHRAQGARIRGRMRGRGWKHGLAIITVGHVERCRVDSRRADEHGAESTDETSGSSARKIEMTLRILLEKRATCRQTQQHIVVSIKNRDDAVGH
jgi:hypothetical protein